MTNMGNKTESKTLDIVVILKIIFGIIALILLGFASFNVYKTTHFDKYAPNWREVRAVMDSYQVTANHYNEQKQLVIDAYNKQLDKIAKNGLKTQDDFDGIKFKTNAFENAMRKDEDCSTWGFTAYSEYTSLADAMFNNANRRITNLSKYYNDKINAVYDDLKNNTKVSFSSLKEYGDGPKFAQFTYGDFNAIGQKRSEDVKLPLQRFVTQLWVGGAVIAVILFIAVMIISRISKWL